MTAPGTPTRSPLRPEVTVQINTAVSAHAGAADPHTQYLLVSTATALLALKADLDALAAIAFSGAAADLTGTIPSSVLPPLAINETFPVASQAAMLALTAQRGDVAIRSDVTKAFILASDSPSTLADWKEIQATGAVLSVNGQTGTVVLTKASIGLGAVDNTPDAEKPLSTAMVTALNGKADSVHVHALNDVNGLNEELVILTTGLDDLGDEIDSKVALSLVDAKGDLLVANGPDALTRVPVGADGKVLTADSTQASGVNWTVLTSGEQEVYGPAGANFTEWTCDPLICSTHFPTISGTLVLVRHRFREAMDIDEIGFVLQQAGATPGAYSGVAVYADGTGVVARQGQSADQGSVFTSTGAKSLALTTPVTGVTAGEYRWIGYLWQGASPPRLFSPPGPPDGVMLNVGRRRSVYQTGQTGFPATMDIAAMTLNSTTYWFGLKDV